MLVGGTAAAVLLAAIASNRRGARASMGRRPVVDVDRYFAQDCSVGTIYQARRGDLMLGRGAKSITWRALVSAARLQGIDAPERLADDSAARVAYAAMICAAPHNQAALVDAPQKGYRRPHDGRGIDLRSRPAIWLPVPDFDCLDRGVVAPGAWDDGSSTLDLPPELREVLA